MSGSGPIDSEKDGKKMKIRKYILCAGIVGLVALSSGCGQKTDSGATSQAVSEQADTKENAETSGAAGAETEKETAPTVQVVTDDMVPVEADALKDGVYPVEVDSSSSMFHITEAELTVADGKMSAKLTLSGSGYGKVFMGTGEEAEKAGEGDYIQAEESADGKNVFEIPVEALDKGIDCAAYSKKKETWYDRTLVVRASFPSNGSLQRGEHENCGKPGPGRRNIHSGSETGRRFRPYNCGNANAVKDPGWKGNGCDHLGQLSL